MTDPRVLVRLDMVLGLLGLVVALLGLQLIVVAPDVGFPAVMVLAVASVATSFWYRRERTAAAG